MQINSLTIPTSMTTEGRYSYDFKPPKTVGYNGRKRPIKPGNASLTWTFALMDDDEWEWWTQTLLGGADSGEFDQCQLYDDDRALTTFTHCIVYRPVRGEWEAGKHANVVVEIVDIY